MNRKKEIRQSSRILLSLALVLLVLVTVGVSYAIYDYTDLVSEENTIKTGTIKFMYSNDSINIQDNIPVADEIGKTLSNTSNVLDFKILGNVGDNNVPYEITVRKNGNSNNIDDKIKLYLVELNDNSEKEIVIGKNKDKIVSYNSLAKTDIIDDLDDVLEKTIYKGTIPANSKDYEKSFRLRMWISDEVINPNYDINDTFIINVYSNVAVVKTELK